MSARSLCRDCAVANVHERCDATRAGEGPRYESWHAEWVRGMRAYVESL